MLMAKRGTITAAKRSRGASWGNGGVGERAFANRSYHFSGTSLPHVSEPNTASFEPEPDHPRRDPGLFAHFFNQPPVDYCTRQTPKFTSPPAHPQADQYALIWTHPLSPGPAALNCIHDGKIAMGVARLYKQWKSPGLSGNAVSLVSRCNFATGRYLSMSWPSLSGNNTNSGGVGCADAETVREWLVPRNWGSGVLEDIVP